MMTMTVVTICFANEMLQAKNYMHMYMRDDIVLHYQFVIKSTIYFLTTCFITVSTSTTLFTLHELVSNFSTTMHVWLDKRLGGHEWMALIIIIIIPFDQSTNLHPSGLKNAVATSDINTCTACLGSGFNPRFCLIRGEVDE